MIINLLCGWKEQLPQIKTVNITRVLTFFPNFNVFIFWIKININYFETAIVNKFPGFPGTDPLTTKTLSSVFI